MRTECVLGVGLTLGDIVEWQEPATLVLHQGFITVYGMPWAHDLVLVSSTAPKTRFADLRNKLQVKKIGELS